MPSSCKRGLGLYLFLQDQLGLACTHCWCFALLSDQGKLKLLAVTSAWIASRLRTKVPDLLLPAQPRAPRSSRLSWDPGAFWQPHNGCRLGNSAFIHYSQSPYCFTRLLTNQLEISSVTFKLKKKKKTGKKLAKIFQLLETEKRGFKNRLSSSF